MVAKKMEYEQAKHIKEKAALDKAFIHKDYMKNQFKSHENQCNFR